MSRHRRPSRLAPKTKNEIIAGKPYFIVGFADGKLTIEPPFRVITVPMHSGKERTLKIGIEGLFGAEYPERYKSGFLIGQEIGLVKEEDLPDGFVENYHRTFDYSQILFAFYELMVENQLVSEYESIIGKKLPPKTTS